MLDLGFLALLTFGSAGVGLRVLRRLGLIPEHPADALALAVPLGLGILASAALGLGEFGLLNPPGLAILSLFGLMIGARDAVRGLARLLVEPIRIAVGRCAEAVLTGGADLSRPRSRASSETGPTQVGPTESPRLAPGRISSPFEHLLSAALAATLFGTLLTALAPVTDGDALCYHLQVPKLFLSQGAVGFEPDLHETVYPLLTEMLYAVALAARGPVACRLVQWLLGLVFAANVAALARPCLKDRAWWAGAVALPVPAVSNGMSAPLNDVALAAFGTAALFAWTRSHDRPTRAAALAGGFAGLALGVKYPALVLTGLLGLASALAGPLCRSREAHHACDDQRDWCAPGTLRGAVAFGLAALLVGGCWYLRAFIHTGNPVFPFFRHAFGGSGLDEVL
ncbi:MAG TPA: hypothetical protein VKP69_04600, partial [Isosphaeraceae bacterium]|nr:hypothetical protein [Isosphaeraceae bacterium]